MSATATTLVGYTDASIERVTAGNAFEYAYRDLGEGGVPLVLLQHFRGNLDNWDPALIDALASDRRVVTFAAPESRRDRAPGVRRQRRQRPDDPAALLVPPGGTSPGRAPDGPP